MFYMECQSGRRPKAAAPFGGGRRPPTPYKNIVFSYCKLSTPDAGSKSQGCSSGINHADIITRLLRFVQICNYVPVLLKVKHSTSRFAETWRTSERL